MCCACCGLTPNGFNLNNNNNNKFWWCLFKFSAVDLISCACEAASSPYWQNQIFVFVQYLDEDLKVAGKYKGNDYSQYSPWSCDTIGSYIGTKDAKPKDVVAARSVEMAVCREYGSTEERLMLLQVGKDSLLSMLMAVLVMDF